MKKSKWMLLGLLATLGCGSLLDVDTDDLPLVMTRSEYAFEVRGDDATLTLLFGYEFANSTKKVLYISTSSCQREPLFQRLVGEEWVSLSGRVCLAILTKTTAIPRGKIYEGSLIIEWDEQWIAGTYRIILGAIVTETDERLFPVGESIPERFRTSNPFEVIVP